MPKTEFLQIRLTPEERERIWRVAAVEHLEPSTWARSVLLKAIDAYERATGREGQFHREGGKL